MQIKRNKKNIKSSFASPLSTYRLLTQLNGILMFFFVSQIEIFRCDKKYKRFFNVTHTKFQFFFFLISHAGLQHSHKWLFPLLLTIQTNPLLT